MKLQFFGRGCGFADEHTSAYFTYEKEMVIIDCPILTFQKVKHMDLNNCDSFCILITHTHGDHIGGLGIFIQYAYYVLKKPVTVVAPSETVANDLLTILEIEGNDKSCYKLITAKEMKNKPWFGNSILTKHDPILDGKCFGYNLTVDGTNIVYTGDTSTIEPFMPYLIGNSELYVDTSVHYGMVHLKLETALNSFLNLNKKNIKVYLTHIDDAEAAKEIVANYSDINVVETI
jgi:ribonuclease BN (tRNA processing enzyme)